MSLTAPLRRVRNHALALLAAASVVASLGGGAGAASGALRPVAPGGDVLTARAFVETAALVSGGSGSGAVAEAPDRDARTDRTDGRDPVAAPAVSMRVALAATGGRGAPASHLLALLRAGLPATPSTGPPSFSV